MITQDQLDADKAAIAAATQQLAADQATFDAAQPHISVLEELEAYANNVSGDAVDAFRATIAKALALW